MAQRWNAKVMFPTDSNFINRITSVGFGPSNSSGNPMITFEYEVLSPETVNIAGEDFDITGVKCKEYLTTKNLKEPDKDKDRLKQCKEFFAMLFPDDPARVEAFDPSNPNLEGVQGLCVYTMMAPDVVEQRKNPSMEEIEKAKAEKRRPEGEIMKHPVTGKALVQYWPRVKEVFGLAPATAGANKPY